MSQRVFLIGGDAAMEFKVSHRNTGPLYVYIYIHVNVCVYIYIYIYRYVVNKHTASCK